MAWWKRGDPEILQVQRHGMTPAQRLWAQVDRRGPTDCWRWTSRLRPNGYAYLTIEGKSVLAHRLAYGLLVGPIPEGMTLDHLCRNTACVNPAHLEPVERAENTRRARLVNALLLTGGMSWLAPVWKAFPGLPSVMCQCTDEFQCRGADFTPVADVIITVGWRHFVPPEVVARRTVVGFHSAKLPEYPGRAPVPWAILRGDAETANTMLYLTDEPDAGDIIDSRPIPVTTASEMNRRMGETAAEMLRQHLPALLTGSAPRTPQDRSRRGPLTTANGWSLLPEDRR